MTIEQLKMLVMVAQKKTIKQASEVLFKTQPAISQGIRQLENQLGLTLFNRDGYRLELTAKGKQIYQHALLLLNESEHIQKLASHLSQGNEASITLAFEASFDLNKILPVLDKTQSEFPDTQIIIRQEYISGAYESLTDKRADIVISAESNHVKISSDVDLAFIYQGSLINVVAPRLLMRHQNLSSVKSLRNEYQILIQDSGKGTLGIELDVQLAQRCWYANDFSTKKKLILSGMGWGKLPENIIQNELESGELIKLELTDAQNTLHLNYCAMRLRSSILGPAASKLWKNLERLNQNNKLEPLK